MKTRPRPPRPEGNRNRTLTPDTELSPRQIEVLELVFIGKINPEIAIILGIQLPTVANTLKVIYEKLNATTRTGAVYQALRLGYLKAPNRYEPFPLLFLSAGFEQRQAVAQG